MKQNMYKTDRPRVTHFGTARIGNDISYDCAVLEDGRRGYILKTLRSAIGMRKNIPVPVFERFCAEIAPNTLKYFPKSGSPFEVIMPHGGRAIWVEVGILPDLAADIVQAEIKTRKKSEKLYQWLEDGGLKLLEKQRDAVMMIARVSSDYRDFEARCSIAFYKHGQQIKLAFPL